jgi:hypothetical protein
MGGEQALSTAGRAEAQEILGKPSSLSLPLSPTLTVPLHDTCHMAVPDST